ncbi:MAG: hypothetical protein HUU50_14110 [Candidatus Brocadiae bacterium]|nr:hypothetical protein [Candidatus Brocadiia bacterium]
MEFHTIITHEYPDLDAMLCCYLLQQYGEKRYPGISKAKLCFYPAGRLPDNKTPEELEKEGILAVDIGGGKLDTHPDGITLEKEKLTLSASNLVAQDLGVENKESLKDILEFTRLQDSAGQSLRSKNPIDHTTALPNIIRGALIHFGNNFLGMTQFFLEVFQSIEASFSGISLLGHELNPGMQEEIFENLNLKKIMALYLCERHLQCKLTEEMYISEKYFDHFVQSKGIESIPEFQKIISFVKNLKPRSYFLQANTSKDQIVGLPNILKGFYHLYRNNPEGIYKPIFLLFDCIVSYEKSWQDALVEYKTKSKIYQLDKIKIVAIEAQSALVVKAARFQDKADIVIYKDETRLHISISVNKLGKLKNFTFRRLAAKLRIAEMLSGYTIAAPISEIPFYEVGEVVGWFLHQSQKLLVHGSPKAHREPSLMPFELILEIALTEWDMNKKIPDRFCPVDNCIYEECPFYALRLHNCFLHREKLRISDKPL